jgi:hypothetical protein
VISLEPTECWFGFIYTKNMGQNRFKEELTPKLKGLEVFGREISNTSEILVDLPGDGHDDIIILRRFEGACNFGMTSKIYS